MATSPSKEYPGPGVTPAYQQQPYSPPPTVPNPAYQHGYQQAQYQPPEAAATAAAAAEVTDEKADDTKSDTGIDTPGIPEQYLNLEFDKCFQQHKSTSTIPLVYQLIGYVFKYTKLVVYNIFVIAFGFLFAFLWGFLYGLMSFILSWIWSPSLRLTLLTVNAVLPAATEPLRALFLPLVDVSARIFRQIRIKATLDGGLLLPIHKVETRPHEA